MYERTTMPSGLRVISARLPGTRAFSAAVYVLVGSRQEQREKAGLAHFMEHITFKGTRDLPDSRAVSETIEGVGGMSNAATDRESTVYWARLPVREAERAMHVLGELTLRPRLRDADIIQERDIIIEEIRSYRDDPGQYVFNLWDEAFFGDTPMGREIAGDETTVAGLSPNDIREFWAAAYRPGNMVVAVAGDVAHEDVVAMVERDFDGGGRVPAEIEPAPRSPVERLRVEERGTAQAHVCLGTVGLPRDDAGQWTLELLNVVLGGGASSRLFLKVREEAGLAYDVHSFQIDYADAGTLQVYMGVDPTDLQPATEAVLAEMARLRDERIDADELERARNYTIGRMELRLEESRAMASFVGTQEALHDRVMTTDEVIEALRAVTADDVMTLAGRLFRDESLCLSAIGQGLDAARIEAGLRLP